MAEGKVTTQPIQTSTQPMVREQLMQEMSLPQLMGALTRRILQGMQNPDPGMRQAELKASTDTLHLWYESQSPADRKQFALECKKLMETFKQIGDVCFTEMQTLIMRDL